MHIRKNSFIFGTAILVATGLFSRMVGFYYRIFLSRTIGAQRLGIYHLALPIMSVCFAFVCSGIHTAISKYVGASNNKISARRYLYTGLCLSLGLSALVCIPLYSFTPFVAAYLLQEPACTPLIRILTFCIPLECIHSCVNAYHYGIKKAAIPAACQCIEQIFRVGGAYLMYQVLTSQGKLFTELHATFGLLSGELAATLFSVTVISLSNGKHKLLYTQIDKIKNSIKHTTYNISQMAFPLTLNRLSLSALVALENVYIPQRLMVYGYNRIQALSVYGVFTGMAVPFVFFPTVLSNSAAVLLLPSISKAQKEKRYNYIRHAVSLSFYLSMFIGFCFTIGLFVFGNLIGNIVFHNELAGIFIRTLCWICPFIFLNTTLTSILNGLGLTKLTFFISICGSMIRLCFVLFFLPHFGMRAYLIGMLLSFITTSLLSYYQLKVHVLTQDTSPEILQSPKDDHIRSLE